MGITTSNTSASSLYEKNTLLDQLKQYRANNWGTMAPTPPFESASWEEKYWTEKALWDRIVSNKNGEINNLREQVIALEKALEGFLGREI